MNPRDRAIWAGILATGPMTLALFWLQKKSGVTRGRPLPPAALTAEVGERIGITPHASSNQRVHLTMISHFGYGVACAWLYEILLPGKIKKAPPRDGAVFGAAVWLASYFGLIPTFGFTPSGYRMSRQRNWQMFLAHLVWGACLGMAENELRTWGNEVLDGSYAI